MNYQLTEHARDALKKRRIPLEWLERAFEMPDTIGDDLVDEELEHRLIRIPEARNRVLRIIINTKAEPQRIVTVYFDRKKTKP